MNFIIDLVIYPYKVMISFKEKDKKLFKRLRKFKVSKKELEDTKLEGALGKYIMFSSGFSLIRLPKIPKSPYDYSILVHEIGHATIAIMRLIGMPLSETSEEAYTYLQGYITYKILKKCKTNI